MLRGEPMRPIISVTTARTDAGLIVSLDDLKSELQVTAADTDDYYTALLKRVSETIERYCNRVFAVESVLETFRFDPCLSWVDKSRESLELFRDPVVTIDSVVADGTTLTADTDYVYSAESDELYRVSSDVKSVWGENKIEVSYTVGHTSTPGPVQQAVFELVKINQATRTGDPSLRSENILGGLYSYQRFAPTDFVGGMPSNVAAWLDGYRRAARA